MDKTTLVVEGMHCAACAKRVEKAVQSMPGIASASVNIVQKKAYIEHNSDVDIAAIVGAIDNAGYKATPEVDASASSEASKYAESEMRTAKRNLLLVWPLSVLSMLPMVIPSVSHGMQHDKPSAIIWVCWSLAAMAVFLPGWSTISRAAKQAMKLEAGMDLLIALGTVAALLSGLSTLFGSSLPDYAMVGGMIMAFHLTGRFLETRARSRAAIDIAGLIDLGAKQATLERDGKTIEVPADSLVPGDIVHVRPGGKIPQDGLVIEGSAGVDESIATGESIPTTKNPGDKVIGATINLDGFLRVKVTSASRDSFLAQIIRLVQDAQGAKIPIQAFADKIISIFVPVVLLVAVAAFLFHMMVGDSLDAWYAQVSGTFFWVDPGLSPLARAVSAAIATLVIACPCALGLATPMALMVGFGVSAKRGVLFRNGSSVQVMKETSVVLLDKTGTVTAGRPKVEKFIAVGDHIQILGLAAAMEEKSEHPLGEAVREYALREGNKSSIHLENFLVTPGRGVSAMHAGVRWRAGSHAWATEAGVTWPDDIKQTWDEGMASGMTGILIFDESRIHGAFLLADGIRLDSKQAVDRLRAMGKRVALLTGDRREAAERIGKELGLDEVKAEVLPADKLSEVRKAQAGGVKVAMVGDGINDAPALKAADVGIAMGAGADIAREAGDIVLVRTGISALAEAFALSGAIFTKIRQNLFWAFFYNALAIPFAFSGLLHPLLAEAAMALSSLNVIWNSLRLRNWRFDESGHKPPPPPSQSA